jgi:nitroreductase
MELTEALRTNPAVREFTDEPVPRDTVLELLDVARFAPSGGNRQPWRVAVVESPQLRRALADLCQEVWNEYAAQVAAGETPFSSVTPTTVDLVAARQRHAPNPLLEHLEEVPVVLVVAADLASLAMMDQDLDRPTLTGGASIYPFCHNILLAARDRGLGGVMTTFLARAEERAGPLLGLPRDWAIAAMLCLGVPARRATRLRRNEVAVFTTLDRFDGPTLG